MKSDIYISDGDALLSLAVLSNHPVFSAFPTTDLLALISDCTINTYLTNEVVVQEGELVNAVYFILDGQCEVRKHAINAANEPIEQPIATLREEESIGLSEVGLFSSTGNRTATIVALSVVKILCVNIKTFRRFLQNRPNADNVFTAQLDMLMRMYFIKSVAPFASISNQNIKHIAEHIEERSFPSGATIFAQGDFSDACYIVAAGKVEIVKTSSDGSTEMIAELQENSIFGESALMSDGIKVTRAVAARATDATILLIIDRFLFHKMTERHGNSHEALMQLQLHHSRPVKINNIDVYVQRDAEGDEIHILRNKELKQYVQLSEQGMFLWNLLDGESTINEIAIRFFLQFRAVNTEEIANQIINLHDTGFVQLNFDSSFQENPVFINKNSPQKVSNFSTVRSGIQKIADYNIIFGNADEGISKLFNHVGGMFFAKPALVFWWMIVVAGFASFIVHFNQVIDLFASSPYKWSLFFLTIVLVVLSIPLYELARALTAKHYGRAVRCFGFGWTRFVPFAYSDTSDTWLSPKRQRVIVDLAGVYFNAMLAGLAGLGVLLVPPDYPTITILLEFFALGLYLMALANLDLAYERDGYHALADALEKPNLRLSSIKWGISLFAHEKKTSEENGVSSPELKASVQHHQKEAIYWLSTLLNLCVVHLVIPYIVLSYLISSLMGNSVGAMGLTLVIVLTLGTFILFSFSFLNDFFHSIRR